MRDRSSTAQTPYHPGDDSGSLVGREQLLRDVIAATAEGGVLLYGPAGIGKSSLVHAVASRAAGDGSLVLHTTSGAADRDLPYLGLLDLLGGLHDQLGPLLPGHLRRAIDAAFLRTPGEAGRGPEGRLAVRLAALELLRMAAARQSVLLVCDDVQWLDAASADVLSCVVPRLKGLSVHTLLAERVGAAELPTRTELCVAPVTEQAVPELAAADIEALLRARFADILGADVVGRLATASAGNAYLAIELGRAARHRPALRGTEPMSVPEKLHAVVGRRVADLPAALRGLLLAAAAVARPTRALLAACDPEADRLLTEAAATGVVTLASDGAVRFSHPLIAEIVYADAAPEERLAVHRVIADAVDDPVERARHLAIAHPEPDPAVASLLDGAAESARRRGIPLTAAELAELAAERTPATARVQVGRRLLTAAEYAFAGGDPRRTTRLAEAAIGAGDAAARVTARLLLAELLGMDLAAREPLLEAAMADAGEEPALAARVWRYRVDQALSGSDPEAAAYAAERATGYAETAGDAELLVDALVGRWRAGSAMGGKDCETHLERAYRLSLEPSVPLTSAVVTARDGWARALARRGEVDGAVAVIESVLGEMERAGQLHDLAWLAYAATTIYERAGRCGDAYATAVRGSQLLLDIEPDPGIGLLLRGMGELSGGSLDAAAELLDAAVDSHARAAEPEWLGMTLWQRGRVHLAAGEVSEAAAVLRRCQRTLTGRGFSDPATYPFDADLAEALVGIGEPDAAAEVLADAEHRAEQLGRNVVRLPLARARALLRAHHGDRSSAATELRSAIDAYAGHSYPIDVVRAWLALAGFERRNRRRAQARAAANAALELCTAAGATVLRQLTEAELARIDGVRDLASLTATERRIVDKVRSGATNQEIATALFLSVKAVEGTLTRLYRQLGVRNRTELARTTEP